MTGNNHLLQKVTFEIGLSSQDGAFEIQNRISNAFRSGVLTRLEQLFDSKVGAHRVVCIDKLEIDLGKLLSAQLETDLESALLSEMEDFVVLLNTELEQQEMQSSGSFATKRINVRWSVPGKPDFETEVKVSDNVTSHFEKVIRYLQSGIFSGGSAQQPRQKLSALMNAVLEKQPEELVRFIRSTGRNSRVFQRLVMNLTGAQLMYVAALLGCRFSSGLSNYIAELKELFRSAQIDFRILRNPYSLHFAEAEHYIWWLILTKYAASTSTDSVLQDLTRVGGSSTSSVNEEVKLLTEIILITRQLSERSDFPTNGNQIHKYDYQMSSAMQEAIEFVSNLTADNNATDENDTTNVLSPSIQNSAMFSDSAALLKNSLFTLPEKGDTAIHDEMTDDLKEAESGIYIENAGLVILAPFLKPFFSRLNLLDGKNFVSVDAQWKAVHILQHACGFTQEENEQGWDENSLILNKLLCGLQIEAAIPENIVLNETERKETEELLKSVLHHWTILRSSSVFALQSTFLQKKGRLMLAGRDWHLLVERDSAVEILIDKLPWGISLIKLPWNEFSIHTEW